ncbi:MAG: hypothetical protein IJ719_09440 [Clostridia bacterium]|nr:hypothetical protein [Clostridia bacterium]
MARLLTLEEIKNPDTKAVAAEWIGFHGIELMQVTVDHSNVKDIVTFNHFERARTDRMYGIQWRCWDEMPTLAEREAAGMLLSVKPS